MAVFRIEKKKDYTVMSNHHLRNRSLSYKAKGMLSLMLSLPEDWDYTMEGLAKIAADGLSSVRSCVKELEQHGYLLRRRVRNDAGQLMEAEYIILEVPHDEKTPENKASHPICENRMLEDSVPMQPTCENPILDNPTLENPMVENRRQLNIQGSNTKQSSTNPSINPKDRMEQMEAYHELILANIDYDILVDTHGRERMDELVELLVETVCTSRDTVRIAKDDFPAAVVRSRLLKLNSDHVDYVFGCLDDNTTKVHNIKAYLLAALYNAPATIDSYYRAAVNHDMNRRE